MKVNYVLNNDNAIIGYTIIPFDPSLPSIEVNNEHDIHIGVSQIINGEFIANDEAYAEIKAEQIASNNLRNEINQLKFNLQSTDYEAIKFSEGEMTAEEFEPYKVQRHAWRVRIRELEEQLEN